MKNNKLLSFIKSKAPQLLDSAGDLLPENGILGIVKNLIDTDSDKSPEERQELRNHLLELYSREVEDRKSAREMRSEQIKSGKIDPLYYFSGFVALAAFGVILYTVIYLQVPESNSAMFHQMIGLVEGIVLSIFAFFFGPMARKD